ncbi:hypothetical protein MHH56_11220 [Paenibacillus sp. FSL K6-3182]
MFFVRIEKLEEQIDKLTGNDSTINTYDEAAGTMGSFITLTSRIR